MFALNARQAKLRRFAPKGRDGDGGYVVPRVFRRPARFFSKVFDGEIRVPRHAEVVGIAAIFGATALYGSIVGGQFREAAIQVSSALGFAVSEVAIVGHENTSEIAVFEALELAGYTSLVTLDIAEARAALSGLPWVEVASVRKTYPGTLEISLTEKDAFAIWQTGETLSLIERDGSVIGAYAGSGFNPLPLVVGPGAAKAAAPFMQKLAAYAPIANEIKALIHVGERRWDVRLANGVTVKLPAQEPEKAIERLLAMDAETGLLGREIASVDLRLQDRTVVALTENSAARREAALKARAKALKDAKRSSI